jgi:hypothetical protein
MSAPGGLGRSFGVRKGGFLSRRLTMRAHRLLPLLLLLSACDPGNPLEVAADGVEVDAALSAADPRALDFDVINRGSRPVYVAACDDHIVTEVQSPALWDLDQDFNVFCRGNVSSIPVAVAPGGSAHGVARVPGPGEFRVVVVLRDRDDAEQHRLIASDGVVVP